MRSMRDGRYLERGGTALDAIEAAVMVMEEDDTFDAGRGSFLTCDGTVEMDALIMDGATLRAGGVGGVRHVRSAIKLSRLVLEKSPHVYFVGEGRSGSRKNTAWGSSTTKNW